MEVIFSSSYDEKNPPENVFDHSKKTFFASTGILPQEIWIQFEPVKIVNGVNLTGYGIKKYQSIHVKMILLILLNKVNNLKYLIQMDYKV